MNKRLFIILSCIFLAVSLMGYLLFRDKGVAEKSPGPAAEGDGSLPIKTRPVKRTSGKGLYVSGNTFRSASKFNAIRQKCKAAGLDTLVIDIKEYLAEPFLELLKQDKLSPDIKITPDPWLYKLTETLHNEGFIVTGRIVVFPDKDLAKARPDLTIKLKKGAVYKDRSGLPWGDPYSEKVRLFNELIAETAAASGVDEIQFDYIRFPVDGANRTTICPFETKGISHIQAINLFLESVKKRTEKYNVSIAIDVFGVIAWQNEKDGENLGQDIKQMSRYVDVISPMLYPSHFNRGHSGFKQPGAEPYYFINEGTKRTKKIIANDKTMVIPWIQGFKLRAPNYGPDYILKQIKAVQDTGSNNFLIWNASSNYDAVFEALIDGKK